MPVHSEDVCYLGAHAVIDFYLTATGFVQDRYFHTIAESACPLIEKKVHVLNVCVGTYIIIGNVIGYILNQGIISYGDIVKGAFPEAGMLPDASREGENLSELSKLNSP